VQYSDGSDAAAAVNATPAAEIRFSAGDGPVVNFLNIWTLKRRDNLRYA